MTRSPRGRGNNRRGYERPPRTRRKTHRRRRRPAVGAAYPPAAPNPLTRQALAKEAEAEAAAEDWEPLRRAAGEAAGRIRTDRRTPTRASDSPSITPRERNSPPPPSPSPRRTRSPSPRRAATRTAPTRSRLTAFASRSALSSPRRRRTPRARSSFPGRHRRLRASAGKLGEDFPAAAYVVCPAAPTAEERRSLAAAPEAERRRHVTCHWLETCAQQGFAIPLTGEEEPTRRIAL